jgi:hypothetical protein
MSSTPPFKDNVQSSLSRQPLLSRQGSVVSDRMSITSITEEQVIEIPDSPPKINDPDPKTNQSILTPETSGSSGRLLTAAEFEFALTQVDSKINSVYKMCQHIGDEQQEILKGIRKLVAIDELSDGFWKV